jgi:hypothetical protein
MLNSHSLNTPSYHGAQLKAKGQFYLYLYISPNIVPVINSRRMRWRVMWQEWERYEIHAIFWLENLNGRGHLENIGVNVKIILERILGKEP